MNVLAIDTATEACSVALDFEQSIYNRFEICPQGHSQRLLPMVDEVLKEANVELADLDYLAFGRGPGSFTGVRIATGMMQGLALGSELPVVGVSTLAAMAQQAIAENNSTNVVAAIDARMNEVYLACYAGVNGLAEAATEEIVAAPQQALKTIPFQTFTAVGTGWNAYSRMTQHTESSPHSGIIYPNAKFMLPLAKRLIAEGRATPIDEIKPVYLRDKVTWKKLPGR